MKTGIDNLDLKPSPSDLDSEFGLGLF